MAKRKFCNRRWKGEGYKGAELEICQDSYTDDELNICAGSIGYWTMITKSELLRFAKELKERKDLVFSDFSNFEGSPFLEAKKNKKGYFFRTSPRGDSVELTFEKTEKVIEFLEFNCN